MEDYSTMAKPEKVWCLLNGAAGHEVDATGLAEGSQYRNDIEGLIGAKTSVARLLVDHYSGSDNSVDDVRNIEIPYKNAFPEDGQRKVEKVNELLNSATGKPELLIAGRDAVSLYQDAIGYETRGKMLDRRQINDSDQFTGAFERMKNLAEYARDQGDEEMGRVIEFWGQNGINDELREFAEGSRWDVDPEEVDAIDLRIWSRNQLEGPPFRKYPNPDKVISGESDFEGYSIEHAWDIL